MNRSGRKLVLESKPVHTLRRLRKEQVRKEACSQVQTCSYPAPKKEQVRKEACSQVQTCSYPEARKKRTSPEEGLAPALACILLTAKTFRRTRYSHPIATTARLQPYRNRALSTCTR